MASNDESKLLELATVASELLEAMLQETESSPKNLKEEKSTIKRRLGSRKRPRSCSSSRELSYEQLCALSMKELVDRYTISTDDELSRKFSYTCLFNSKCRKTFDSFGNEDAALSRMKAHLRNHLEAWASTSATTPGRSKAEIELFSEENPRSSADTVIKTRSRSKTKFEGFSKEDPHSPSGTVAKTNSTAKTEMEGFSEEDPHSSADTQAIIIEKYLKLKKDMKSVPWPGLLKGTNSATSWNKFEAYVKELLAYLILSGARASAVTWRSKADIKLFSEEDPRSSADPHAILDEKCSYKKELKSIFEGSAACTGIVQGASSMQVRNPESQDHTKHPLSDTHHDEMIDASREDPINKSEAETERSLEEDPRSAQFFATLLEYINEVNSVLHNDHDYFVKEILLEKRRLYVKRLEATWDCPIDPDLFPTIEFLIASPTTIEFPIDSQSTIEPPFAPTIIQPQFIVETPVFPYVHTAEHFNLAGIEECKADGTPVNPKLQYLRCAVHPNFDIDSKKQCCKAKKNNFRTNKKFPTSSRRQIVTGSVLESMENQAEFKSSGSFCVSKYPRVRKQTDSENRENLKGIEKMLAKRFIDDMIDKKTKKKKPHKGPYKCKLCPDKEFTAQATLIHHYNGHAGIKEYSCSVCNGQFTRLHSLRYHMSIHNETTRFDCPVPNCNRSFRHPSHYKEHLRSHTGETPYECSDCHTRFKTRNTYKRHLKAQHGKFLTAKNQIYIKTD